MRVLACCHCIRIEQDSSSAFTHEMNRFTRSGYSWFSAEPGIDSAHGVRSESSAFHCISLELFVPSVSKGNLPPTPTPPPPPDRPRPSAPRAEGRSISLHKNAREAPTRGLPRDLLGASKGGPRVHVRIKKQEGVGRAADSCLTPPRR